MPRSALLLLVVVVLTACRQPGEAGDRSGAGTLAFEWTGSTPGRFNAPAAASWCESDSLLEVVAARHDTAVGFMVLTRATLDTGGYPIFPASLISADRPQAGVALRWLTEGDVMAFEAAGGTIRITARDGARFSGTVSGELHRQFGQDTVKLTGTFTRLELKPAAAACGRAVKP